MTAALSKFTKPLFSWTIIALAICACSSPPPPKPPPPPEPAPAKEAAPAPVVQEELGSIDDGAIEGVFVKIGSDLETCHTAGRARVPALSGDVTVFMRIDAHGALRYGYLAASTIGDRDTEKCIMDLLGRTTWPSPVGGEAEVTHGFGWEAGSERPPTIWESDKISSAIDASTTTKHAIDQCKHGANNIQFTGYISSGPPVAASSTDPAPTSKKSGAKKKRKKPGKSKGKSQGHFRALGGATSSVDAADKIDCMVDALKNLTLPSPGSTTAKVFFTL